MELSALIEIAMMMKDESLFNQLRIIKQLCTQKDYLKKSTVINIQSENKNLSR